MNWQAVDIRYATAALSLLISALVALNSGPPNDDAFTYIRSAEIFLADGFSAAFAHYQWAAYPVLMALLHSVLGISLIAAAYLLNAAFFSLLCFSFISVVREIDSSRRVSLLAAITVLVYPQLNEFRNDIFRDAGFWALSIFALWQFLEFGKQRDYRHAFAFCLALLLATFLRIEALAYLLLTPLVLLFDQRFSKQQRLRFAAFYTGISLGLVLLAYLVFRLLGVDLLSLAIDFISEYGVFLRDILMPDEASTQEFASAVFSDHAANIPRKYLVQFLLGGLAALLLVNLFNGIGGPFLIILVTGFIRRELKAPTQVTQAVLAFMAINVLIVFAFLLVTRYLSSRYGMLFCITLALFVPLVLHRLLLWAETVGRNTAVVRVMSVFLLYCAFDAYVSFGENKSYIFASSNWVNARPELSSTLLTNNRSVAYYTGRVEAYDEVPPVVSEDQIAQLASGDLLIVELNFEMRQLLNSEVVVPLLNHLQSFPEDTDPRIAIYQRK